SRASDVIRSLPVGAECPLVREFVVTHDIGIAIAGRHFEITVVGRQPAIGYGEHAEPLFAEYEGSRFLFAAVARVTLDLDRHRPPFGLPVIGTNCTGSVLIVSVPVAVRRRIRSSWFTVPTGIAIQPPSLTCCT